MPRHENASFSLRVVTGAFVVFLLILGAAFWGEYEGHKAADVVFQIRTRQLQALQMLSALQDAETGQRGFLITEDQAFLEPYTNALAEIGALRDEFSRVIEEDTPTPGQDAVVNELIDRRLRILAQVIALVRAGDRSAAMDVVKSGTGKAAMDGIRAITHEADLVRSNTLAVQQRQQDRIAFIVRIVEVLGIVILVIAAVIVIRQSRLALAAQRSALAAQASAADAAQSANKAKSAFLASMSHELRTPMTGIIGMCDLLLAGEQSAEDRQITQMLARSAQTLLGLLNDILDLSKVEAGRLTLEEVDFKLSGVLEEIASLFGSPASQKGLILDVAAKPTDNDVFRGDPKRLQQVLANLVGNAIKFTERGSITVATQQQTRADGKVDVTFEVRDTGIGISEDAKKRLFRDFEQEDVSTARNYGGTGLGLSISRRLINAMNGTIGVESVKGIGSRFFFVVPLATGNAQAITKRLAKSAQQAGDQLRERRLRILLAEDTAVSRHLIATMFTRWGHEIRAVADGREAVRAADECAWDLILMDMQMPIMDGPEAVAVIRKGAGPSAKSPIIALTADALVENHAGYLAAGCNLVATKPIDWHVLTRQIAELLGLHEPLQPQPDSSPSDTASAIRVEDGWRALPIVSASDLSGLEELLGRDVVANVIPATLESFESCLAELKQAAAASNTVDIKRVTHRIVGTASQFGAARLSALARAIETQADSIERVRAMIGDLENAVTESNRQLTERFGL